MAAEGYTLTHSEERILASCVGSVFDQIVWDLNAVYLVSADTACIKIEVVADVPPPGVRSDEYDEVVFIRVDSFAPAPHFDSAGEEGFWYRVVASESRIRNVEIARAALCFPSGIVSSPNSIRDEDLYVLVDAGVLLTLDNDLIVPAVSLFNSFRFAMWPDARLYERAEVDSFVAGTYAL